MIEEYFNHVNASTLINFYRQHGELNDSQRRDVIKHVVNFMFQRFGEKANASVRKAVAMAAIDLFKCWRVQKSKIGGIVSVLITEYYLKIALNHDWEFFFRTCLSMDTMVVG